MAHDRKIEVPIDYDPRTITGDGPSAQTARGAMNALHGAWVKIRDAAADQSVDLPRLAKAAQGAMERALTASDAAQERIVAQVRQLETEIVNLTQPRVDATLAAEMRAYWREKGWTNGLPQAVAADPRTASAILSAPPYLSGLDDKTRDVIRLSAINAHAADKQAALDEAKRAHDRVVKASARMIEVVVPRLRDWSRPDNANLAALETMGNG
jgi:hypothetical protein